jgi:hypothetical protein
MLLDRQRALAVIHRNIPFSQQTPFNPVSVITSVQKPQPWRDIVKKKLGTTLLLITLSCGIANADCWTPGHRAPSKPTTWSERINNAWSHFKAWF